jgi:hypothetical protein
MNDIHHGEVWKKSQCMKHETSTDFKICNYLIKQGYQQTQQFTASRSAWQHNQHQVIVSLVDDFWLCADDHTLDTPYLFTKDTTIITDSWVNAPTIYQIRKLPDSFFGIYFYSPDHSTWAPDRDFTYAVNRVDFRRIRILLNLYQAFDFDHGYVNFNCVLGQKLPLKQNFIDQFTHATQQELPTLHKLSELMPMKNYSIEHDQTYLRSWLNIMVETYSSDNVISLSEKIFRCLVTPAPWIVYSGKYTIARLKSLGFDVLDDVVNHNYDKLIEAHHKIPAFINSAQTTIQSLKNQDWKKLQQRCKDAAAHNQQLLLGMSQSWHTDFNNWLPKII